MRLFPLVIGLLAVLSIGIPSVVAEAGSAGIVDDSTILIIPTMTPKPISFESYEEAFAIPTVKPLSFSG
jgi:hypothetical protein